MDERTSESDVRDIADKINERGREHIVLVGSDEAIQQFRKQFDVSPIESEN
jgi:hypothetical protein